MVRFDGTTTRQCLLLNIADDNEPECNEMVVLMLEVNSTTEPFYMDVSPSSMMLKIVDDDSKYRKIFYTWLFVLFCYL